MSPTVEDRRFATPALFGSERALLRSRRLLSCRSRGARARARFGFSGRDDRLRDSSPCSLCVWFPASLPARIPRTALAVPGCLERRSRDFETERATAFPRGLTGACLTRRITRVRARRARPPPFAPRGAASPASPRGAASLSSACGISFETPPSGSPDHEGSRMMLQGVQRCFALDPPGPRGAGPGGDPGPFDRCLLLTDSVFRDDSPSLDERRIAFPTRYGSPRFTPRWLTSAIRPTCWSVFFSSAVLPACL
jgi:hypothetical protein